MLEAKFRKAGFLKRCFDAVKDLLSDALLEFSEDGLHMQATDTDQVSLVSLKLEAAAFESYNCSDKMQIGINIPSFLKVLKCAGQDDIVTIKAYPGIDFFTLEFEARDVDFFSVYDLKLINLEQQVLEIPDFEGCNQASMLASEFWRVVKNLSLIGSNISIICKKAMPLTFKAGGAIGNGCISFQSSNDENQQFNKKLFAFSALDDCDLVFSARYLCCFGKAAGLSRCVSLSFEKDMPLKAEFIISAENMYIGNLVYYLAPKVDDSKM